MGDVSHVSPLWRRVLALSGLPDEQACEWLLKCAVERGASHYSRPFPPDLPPDRSELSDEEIGVALCLGQHPYNSVYIRAAAQLLTFPQIDVPRLARLVKMERVETVFNHIARVAERYAPALSPWKHLRLELKPRVSRNEGALPHWSRFVSQTGVTIGGGGPEIQWLRRREAAK